MTLRVIDEFQICLDDLNVKRSDVLDRERGEYCSTSIIFERNSTEINWTMGSLI